MKRLIILPILLFSSVFLTFHSSLPIRSGCYPEGINKPVSVLLLMDHEYGANYNITDSSLNIREQFEQFGWNITITGLYAELQPCNFGQKSLNNSPIRTDILVSDIKDIMDYQALVIMPGQSYKNLLNDKEVLELIRKAVDNDLVVAAWCRGVRLLAAADVIRGKTITGHTDYEREYQAAGARYIGFSEPDKGDAPYPIADGNIITTVRSRYFRTKMCQLIKNVVERNLADSEAKDGILLFGEPVWEAEEGQYSTGIGYADVDQNGWKDLVVSSGLDYTKAPAKVYFNESGIIPMGPGSIRILQNKHVQ